MTEHKSYKFYTKAESPYLGEWDLNDQEDLVLTVAGAGEGEIVGEKGRTTKGLVIRFVEHVKPLFCNITNARTIEKIYGTKYVDEWVGKKIQLYVEPNISFAGRKTAGIRIRPFVPQTDKAEYHCEVCNKLIDKKIHDASVAKYGKAYCSKECYDADTQGEQIL